MIRNSGVIQSLPYVVVNSFQKCILRDDSQFELGVFDMPIGCE